MKRGKRGTTRERAVGGRSRGHRRWTRDRGRSYVLHNHKLPRTLYHIDCVRHRTVPCLTVPCLTPPHKTQNRPLTCVTVLYTTTSKMRLPPISTHCAFAVLFPALRKSNVRRYPVSARLLSRYPHSCR